MTLSFYAEVLLFTAEKFYHLPSSVFRHYLYSDLPLSLQVKNQRETKQCSRTWPLLHWGWEPLSASRNFSGLLQRYTKCRKVCYNSHSERCLCSKCGSCDISLEIKHFFLGLAGLLIFHLRRPRVQIMAAVTPKWPPSLDIYFI